MSEQTQRLYEFGPFQLNTSERQLLRDGQPVLLAPKAFEMLLVLVEKSGRLVGKDELMKTLWPDSFVEEANLNHHIWALRKALGEGSNGSRYIETVPRHGYRFAAGVRELTDAGAELVVEKRTFTHIVALEDEQTGVEDEAAQIQSTIEARQAHTSLPAPAASSRRAGRAQPLSSALVVGALFVAGAATVFGVYWLISQRQPKDRATVAVPFSEISISRLTISGKITHAAVSPDGEYVAHVTMDSEGDSLWVRHVAAPTSVRIAGPAVTEYASVTFAPDGDSVYYLTLDRDKGDTTLYRVPVLGGPSSMAAHDVGPVGFSPDGRQMVFFRQFNDESRLMVADAEGSNERILATRRRPDFFRGVWNAPAWSPDGKTIACPVRLNDERGHFETIIGVGVEDGAERMLASARWSYVGQPAWLTDGSGLLVTAGESATAAAQIWHVLLESGETTRVTHDLNHYYDLSLTADASRLAAVQLHTVSSIWFAPQGDAGRAKQVSSQVGWADEIAWTSDGRIVYRSNAGGGADIWVMDADGSNPKQLTTGARASRGLAVSRDGRYIFFASDRAGHFNIWRVDADGRNLKQLTVGDGELYPHSTPDGQWIVYQREVEPPLWKVRTDGGEPVQLTERDALRPAVSPDGELIAYHYLDSDLSRWGIGIVSSDGGQRLKRFDFPPTVTHRYVRWSPDGQTIAYPNSPGGVSEIWLQPLDGSPPRRLTDFKAEQILAFDWSRDGRSLAVVRSVETSDVVLIGNAALK